MINNVVLVGRIGQDPEIKQVSETVKLARFSIALDETFRKANEEKQTKTNWITIIAWRKLAEIVESYGKKGKLVAIEGKLESRTWEDENGNKRYATEVNASSFRILDKKEE